MKYKLKYTQFNERSILIEWPAIIDENILKDILIFKNDLKNLYIKVKVDIINTYNSILIVYEYTIEDVYDEFLNLKSVYSGLNNQISTKHKVWEVPVCYDEEFGTDMVPFSKNVGMSISDIIQRHSEQLYTVYFIGFLPGFFYLGGLDKSLHLDRKSTPDLNVKKGSVAIGGNQTGIYPQNSPGGWHIIGNSPVNFFDINENKPCFANAGDKIKFQPVSREEHNSIKKLIELNSYELKSFLI